MLRAHAIVYAIVIALIVSLTSSSVILSCYFFSVEFDETALNEALHLNAASAFQVAMSDNCHSENLSVPADLYGRGNDSVFLKKSAWGMFETAVGRAFYKNKSVVKAALFGYRPDALMQAALFLADHGRSLSLCGATQIKGRSYLPRSGIKRAYIEGQNFSGIRLIEGETLLSEPNLPAVKTTLTERNLQRLAGKYFEDDSLLDAAVFLEKDTLENSFASKTILLHSPQELILQNKHLKGNILIHSDKSVWVGNTTTTEDVLVYAPCIVLEDGFTGSIQLIAGNSVIVGSHCTLHYPSAVCVIRRTPALNPAFISVKAHTEVCGVVFAYQEQLSGQMPVVSIAESSTVTGQVYTNGFAEIKGSVYGYVACDKLLLRTPSSVYENHLLNAVLDATQLPEDYAGAGFVEGAAAKRVVKWID